MFEQTALNKFHLAATSLNWKATVLNKMYRANDLQFVILVFQENYLPSRSVLDSLPAGESKKCARKSTCVLNCAQYFHAAITAG